MTFKNFDKKPIEISGIQSTFNNGLVVLESNGNRVEMLIPSLLDLGIQANVIKLSSPSKVSDSEDKRAIGTFVANLRSNVLGLRTGHKKMLRFTGTKAEVIINGQTMTMKIGLSHPVVKILPENVKARIVSTASKEIVVELLSFSKEAVGQTCKELVCMIKNPYEGGVHIQDMAKPKEFRKRKKNG